MYNSSGLSYLAWLRAACVKSSKETRLAWQQGEDPTDYRAFADFKIHAKKEKRLEDWA